MSGRRGRIWLIGAIALAACGCDTRLVTGYEPRRLGASPAVRRGYYAGDFTREAREAEQDRDLERSARRPTFGPQQ